MDYSNVAKSIADTIAKCSTPLTEDQQLVLAGAVSVWIEKAVQEDAKDAALLSCVKDLTEIVRMPNAEWVADAHNAAVRKLRAAMKESNE